MKNLRSILATLVMVVIGLAVSAATAVTPYITIPGIMALSAFKHPKNVLTMAIQVELWESNIVGNLFKNNEFLNYCYIADEYVIGGKLVHIPQAGNPASVKRNRTSFPATVTLRQDVDVTYALDEFTTDPHDIPNADTIELSYDKISSVLQEDQANLNEIIANWMLFKWAQVGENRFLRTTGGSIDAHLPGATGSRKKFVVDELKRANKMMNKDGVPKVDRYALFSADMYDQLITDTQFTQYRDSIRDLNLPEGVITRLHGFWIMDRATVLVATNTDAPVIKTPDAGSATTDNDVVLCWQKQSVERAMGQTKAFEQKGNPTMFGDVYSFLQRMGGRVRRNDEKGVVLIIQDAA